MIGRITLLIAALLFASAAMAAGPVKITADQFVVDDVAHIATFTGNVVVVRGTMTMWAPKAVVDFGEGGPSDIKSFIASGGVRIKTPDQDATGAQAIYDPKAQTLKLSGNVIVVNASSTVAGPDLLVDLVTNTSTFTGSSTGRVTGVFTPQ